MFQSRGLDEYRFMYMQEHEKNNFFDALDLVLISDNNI